MATDTPEEVESTRLNPGEKYRPDATFDHTKRLGWARLEDEETRQTQRPSTLFDPVPLRDDANLRMHAETLGAPEKPVYLVDGDHYIANAPQSYLDYSGCYVGVPVNQVPFLRKWKPFTARAAHEFDWTMSAHSMRDLTADERWTVEHQMYGLIGASWQVLELLEDVNPRIKDIHGNYDWKTYQADAEIVIAGLCHDCEDVATFARHFAHNANLSLFRGALISGKVHQSDRDLNRWGLGTNVVTQVSAPSGTTPTEESINFFHRTNQEESLKALKYFDTDVGPAERPHAHDE